MKIAVIDDEKPQADILYSICNAYFGGHKQNVQIDCFPDGIAFFNSFKENTYKIAFVDIFMEKMNGIAVAEKLREKDRNILIVFVTTSPDFMMQAFSVHAFHYITKPYKAEQIYKVLDDASSYVSDNSKYIEVMCDRRNTLISLKEIVSVESDAHYINIGVVSGLRYRTRMTITEFLKLADNDTRFIPVNRGIVLNADYIKDIEGSVCVTGNGERFPISKIVTLFLCSFIILGSLSSIVMTAFDIQNLNFVLFPDLVIFFFLIKSVTKAGTARCLFVFISVCCLISFFSLYSYFINSFFQEEISRGVNTSYSLIQMGLSVAAMGALVPLTKYYAWMIDNINIGKVWYLFSILPIALMVSNIYIIPISYANIRVGKVYAKGFIITIFELTLYLIVFILFYIFSKTTIEKTKLTERNNILEIQKSYTESLQSYIKYTSKARHDFKHSVHVMSRLADEGNLSALKDYIAQYENSLTVTAPVRICKSDALNALFNHYRQQAIENHVDINWRIDLPDKSRILDVDLCSIFGNILENAIDGCCTVEEGKRYFNLTSEIKGDCLYIVSTNNYGKPLEMDGETYSSTKHQGKGIGLHSMKSITEVYDGIFDAGNNNGEFFVDIMLKY